MQINNTSPIEELRQALVGSWDITTKTQGSDTWNVVELGMLKIYEATLAAGLHIVPFKDLSRTRIIEIFTKSGKTQHQILKMKEDNFDLQENSVVRILFY